MEANHNYVFEIPAVRSKRGIYHVLASAKDFKWIPFRKATSGQWRSIRNVASTGIYSFSHIKCTGGGQLKKIFIGVFQNWDSWKTVRWLDYMIEARLQWAKQHISFGDTRLNVIFSDGKMDCKRSSSVYMLLVWSLKIFNKVYLVDIIVVPL